MARPTYDELFQHAFSGQHLTASVLSGKNADGTDFIPGVAVYVWDTGTLSWIPWDTSVTGEGGGGGGGPATIADGADVTEGTQADAAIITDTGGTISGKLRGVVKLLASVISAGKVTVDNSGVTQPVSGPLTDAQLRAVAVPVSGTFYQETQPVSAASLPLPSGSATEAKQDTGNTSLASILAALLALLLEQGGSGVDAVGPMAQGLVSDTPNSYLEGELRPLSMTSEGRMRVTTVPASTYLELFRAPSPFFDIPDLTEAENPWEITNHPFSL